MKHALLPQGYASATVVSLKHHYVLVVNSKTAGTTLRTVAAHLENEPLAKRRGKDQAQRAENWIRTPTLGDLSATQLREVLLGDRFFRFTTVRHPFTRAWSAWVDKLLCHHPEYVAVYSGEPWFPQKVRHCEEAVDRFGAFIRALRSSPGLLGSDRHWAPQAAVLSFGTFPYDVIGRTENLEPLVGEWRDRTGLDVQGAFAEVGRRNARSLAFPGSLLPDTTWNDLTRIYERDLTSFEYGAERSQFRGVDDDWQIRLTNLDVTDTSQQTPPRSLLFKGWRGLRAHSARTCRILSAAQSRDGTHVAPGES